MGRVLLVRHGESELNRDGIFYGNLDPKLTKKGREQATKLKEVLKNYNYDKVYSSDLIRARETAEIINSKNIEISCTPKIRELNFGIFEGMKYEEIKKKYPKEEKLWREEWKTFSYITGESVEAMQNRCVEFLEEVRSEEKDILIVAHWGVINSILSHYMIGNLDGYWKFATENCALTILNFNNNFPVLEGMNIGGTLG